jgi:hypothetical protein
LNCISIDVYRGRGGNERAPHPQEIFVKLVIKNAIKIIKHKIGDPLSNFVTSALTHPPVNLAKI